MKKLAMIVLVIVMAFASTTPVIALEYPYEYTDYDGDNSIQSVYVLKIPDKIKIVFDSAKGKKVKNKTIGIKNKMGTLPKTTRKGYSFLGWYAIGGEEGTGYFGQTYKGNEWYKVNKNSKLIVSKNDIAWITSSVLRKDMFFKVILNTAWGKMYLDQYDTWQNLIEKKQIKLKALWAKNGQGQTITNKEMKEIIRVSKYIKPSYKILKKIVGGGAYDAQYTSINDAQYYYWKGNKGGIYQIIYDDYGFSYNIY